MKPAENVHTRSPKRLVRAGVFILAAAFFVLLRPQHSAASSGSMSGMPAIYLSASQTNVPSGTPVMLLWNAIQGTSCTGINFNPTGVSGTLQVTPVRTTTYTVTCDTAFGIQSANTTVTVSSGNSGTTVGSTGGSGTTGSTGTDPSSNVPRASVPTATPGQGTLTDLMGNVWAVDGSNMPTENGTEVQSDPVILLLYTNYVIYEETVNNQWNFWSGLGWVAVTGDPREAASSYLAQPSTSSNSNSTVATGFAVGDTVQVIPGISLRVRAGAGTSANIIGTEAAGSQGTIVGGPQSVAGVNWWQISYADGTTGWSAEPYLVLTSTPPSGSNSPSTSPSSSPSLAVGDTVSAYDILRVYSTGSLSGSVLGTEQDGAQGTIVNGPAQSNGRYWWDVQFTGGITGWVVGDFLR